MYNHTILAKLCSSRKSKSIFQEHFSPLNQLYCYGALCSTDCSNQLHCIKHERDRITNANFKNKANPNSAVSSSNKTMVWLFSSSHISVGSVANQLFPGTISRVAFAPRVGTKK